MAGHLHKESWKIRCKLHSVYFNGSHYSANVNVYKGVVGRKILGCRIHPSPFPLPPSPFPLPPSPFPLSPFPLPPFPLPPFPLPPFPRPPFPRPPFPLPPSLPLPLPLPLSPSSSPFPPSSAPVIKLFTSIKSQDWKFRSRKHANSITWLAQISFSFGCSTCSSHSYSVKINQMVHKVDQRYMQRHLITLPKKFVVMINFSRFVPLRFKNS